VKAVYIKDVLLRALEKDCSASTAEGRTRKASLSIFNGILMDFLSNATLEIVVRGEGRPVKGEKCIHQNPNSPMV